MEAMPESVVVLTDSKLKTARAAALTGRRMSHPMPRCRGLAHVNLNVTDVDRSARFYSEVLGMEIHSDITETIDKDGRSVELRQVVLTTRGRGDLLALTHGSILPVGSGGLNHIGFIFDSDEEVRAAILRVERHGGKLRSHGDREQDGVREAFAYIQDPDGYDVELSTQAILLTGIANRKRC
jgi:catechol 2,3-dioxygenase-like lactoylglutathione lyase family enzyme